MNENEIYPLHFSHNWLLLIEAIVFKSKETVMHLRVKLLRITQNYH